MNQVTDKQVVIYTIGHGSKVIDDFSMLLRQNSIDILVDVRSLPYSRFHPQFRQANLQISLNKDGISYLWMGRELGGRPEDPNLYTKGVADYELMKDTTLFKSGIEQILRFAGNGLKVTLMCSESNPNACHRKHLIADVLVKHEVTVLHINKTGTIEKHLTVQNYGLFN